MKSSYQKALASNENTFIAVSLETGKAVAEVSDRLSVKVNLEKYRLMRPSEYLPTLNK